MRDWLPTVGPLIVCCLAVWTSSVASAAALWVDHSARHVTRLRIVVDGKPVLVANTEAATGEARLVRFLPIIRNLPADREHELRIEFPAEQPVTKDRPFGFRLFGLCIDAADASGKR